MKRLAVLLVAIAAVVAAAAFAVPSNAATSTVRVCPRHAQCGPGRHLGQHGLPVLPLRNNYVAGGGQATYVPVTGRGQGTYNATFVAGGFSKLINGQFISQLAASAT